MGISVGKNAALGGINNNYGVVLKNNVRFHGNLRQDSFEVSSLNVYTAENTLNKAISENPRIKAILDEAGVPCKLNMAVLENLQKNHALDTKNIAIGIIENLPFSLKNKVDKVSVEKAAYLHDVGKALIPEEILNKNGTLNESETKIMHLHSELGFELLKNSNLDKKTLSIIKNHHQNARRTGYPFVDKMFFADINQQIVALADKYSALTEKRAYKDALTPKEALTVIYRDVERGNFNPVVFNSLVKYSQKNAVLVRS